MGLLNQLGDGERRPNKVSKVKARQEAIEPKPISYIEYPKFMRKTVDGQVQYKEAHNKHDEDKAREKGWELNGSPDPDSYEFFANMPDPTLASDYVHNEYPKYLGHFEDKDIVAHSATEEVELSNKYSIEQQEKPAKKSRK